ncbi:MAG: carbonic anhydrase [Acidimicrobiia bacterium]
MPDAPDQLPSRAPAPDPDAALVRLDAGNARFVSGDLVHPRRDQEHRASLSKGQRPYAAVLGCSDSRVPHEILFDEGLGDLFAVRVAGNTALDPLVLGSVEFAVEILGVATVVVLGHEDCGAVKAAINVVRDDTELPGHLMAVVAPIVPVVASVLETMPDSVSDEALVDACVRANVTHTVEHLSKVSLLSDAIAAGTLAVAGREYLLATGEAIPV